MARNRKRERDEEREAELIARRRAAFAQIRQYGDPALRLPAHEVESFDGDLVRLVERMRRLLDDANGVGLAANQVGILRRVALVVPERDADPVALVNPRIVERGAETDVEDEGCLSLQRVLVPVERHLSVVVEARDEHGDPVRLDVEGLGARAAQHELDHLDGVLMIDRTSPEERRKALGVLRPQPVLAPLG